MSFWESINGWGWMNILAWALAAGLFGWILLDFIRVERARRSDGDSQAGAEDGRHE